MFTVTAKNIRSRVLVSRSGARQRRLPQICLARGAVIKIAPGRTITVSRQDILSNIKTLRDYENMIVIRRGHNIYSLSDLESMEEVSEEVLIPPVVELEPEPVIESEPEPEPVIEPEPIVEPEPEPEPVPEKKKPRKRKSRAKTKKAE